MVSSRCCPGQAARQVGVHTLIDSSGTGSNSSIRGGQVIELIIAVFTETTERSPADLDTRVGVPC